MCYVCYSHQPRDRWIVDLVANEYLGDTRDPVQVRDIYREMMGDMLFNIPALRLAKYHSGETVNYSFNHTRPLQLCEKKVSLYNISFQILIISRSLFNYNFSIHVYCIYTRGQTFGLITKTLYCSTRLNAVMTVILLQFERNCFLL